MIGPWKVIINKIKYHNRVVTCIDAVINLPEIISLDNAKSKTVAEPLNDNWINRCHTVRTCIHADGNKFLGPGFV